MTRNATAMRREGRPAPVALACPFVRAAVAPAGRGRASIERSGWLTPYTVETIAEDARGAGRGARLEIDVAADAHAASLGLVEDAFGWLRERGLEVSVRREGRAG